MDNNKDFKLDITRLTIVEQDAWVEVAGFEIMEIVGTDIESLKASSRLRDLQRGMNHILKMRYPQRAEQIDAIVMMEYLDMFAGDEDEVDATGNFEPTGSSSAP